MHLFKISVIDRLHDNGLDMRKQLLVIKSCKIIGLEYQQSKKTVTAQISVNLFIESEKSTKINIQNTYLEPINTVTLRSISLSF